MFVGGCIMFGMFVVGAYNYWFVRQWFVYTEQL